MLLFQENRLAQLATVDQQRELMRYMRGLNEWLERDVHNRQSELWGVVARVDQLRDDIRGIRTGRLFVVSSRSRLSFALQPDLGGPSHLYLKRVSQLSPFQSDRRVCLNHNLSSVHSSRQDSNLNLFSLP
jgi:hypothetical protein